MYNDAEMHHFPMEQMHHEKNRGGRFLQELRGEVRKLFVHFPPKFLQ